MAPCYVFLLVLCLAVSTDAALSSTPQHSSIGASIVRPPAVARKLLQREKYPLSQDPDNQGCYMYRATSSDTIDQIAKDLGVSASELRDRNSKNIADFSRLNGRFIQICNIGNMAATEGINGAPAPRLSAAAPPAPAPAPAPAPKPEPAPAPAPKPEPAPAPKPETPAPAPAESKSPPPSSPAESPKSDSQTTTTTTTTQQQPQQQQQQQGVVVQRAGFLPFIGGIGGMTPAVVTSGGAPASGVRTVSPIGIGFGRR